MTDEVAGVELAGLENNRLENDRLENDSPENDGVEQEQTYILHTKENFNVQQIIVSSTNLKTYIIPHLQLYLST